MKKEGGFGCDKEPVKLQSRNHVSRPPTLAWPPGRIGPHLQLSVSRPRRPTEREPAQVTNTPGGGVGSAPSHFSPGALTWKYIHSSGAPPCPGDPVSFSFSNNTTPVKKNQSPASTCFGRVSLTPRLSSPSPLYVNGVVLRHLPRLTRLKRPDASCPEAKDNVPSTSSHPQRPNC